MSTLAGLASVNIELTNRCNKKCWMCGRRKIETDPQDMDFNLLYSIRNQLPPGIIVQFHNNGEPLMYHSFKRATSLFSHQIRCMDTNGKLLLDKADEIIDNLDTLTVSIIQDDKEADQQYFQLLHFLQWKGDRKPRVILRCLGNVDISRYKHFNCLIVIRQLHSPSGSFEYENKPVIPETGICRDLLNTMSIRADGKVSICVRFDIEGYGVIGNAKKTTLYDMWNGPKRHSIVEQHIKGNRACNKLCKSCEYWGIPS